MLSIGQYQVCISFNKYFFLNYRYSILCYVQILWNRMLDGAMKMILATGNFIK